MIYLLALVPTPFLAALGDQPGFWDDVKYQVVGLVVVLAALAAIWLVLEVVGKVFRRFARAAAPVPAPLAASAVTSLPTDAGAIPLEVIAAIAAAVDTTLGKPHRIVAVQLAEGSSSHAAWSVEGRREIYRSHRIR